LRRILVVKDVGLWIALNRRLAGAPDVQLSEAPTLELGLDLARIERPDLVVVSAESTGLAPEALARRFDEHRVQARRLCVVSGPRQGPPVQGLEVCGPEELFAAVDALAGSAPSPPPLDLLAHFEVPGAEGGEPRRGFATLIQIDEREVLLEADAPLTRGERMTLTFFVPAGHGSERTQISLRCRVYDERDGGRLRYAAVVAEAGDAGRTGLRRFLEERSAAAGAGR